jgi:hypothetical protein
MPADSFSRGIGHEGGSMRAVVQNLNSMLRYCDAVSENSVHYIFRPPPTGLHTGDVIEFNPELLNQPQSAVNITMGRLTFTLEILDYNVHKLLPDAGQGTSASSSPEKLETA